MVESDRQLECISHLTTTLSVILVCVLCVWSIVYPLLYMSRVLYTSVLSVLRITNSFWPLSLRLACFILIRHKSTHLPTQFDRPWPDAGFPLCRLNPRLTNCLPVETVTPHCLPLILQCINNIAYVHWETHNYLWSVSAAQAKIGLQLNAKSVCGSLQGVCGSMDGTHRYGTRIEKCSIRE